MPWHLAIDRPHPRKDGEVIRDYFVSHMGIGNEVSSKVEKAHAFRTKREAEAARREYRCPNMKPTKAPA